MAHASSFDPDPAQIRANTAFIRYPRLNELHQEISECQHISKIAGEPQCMSLEGPPGAGKSTLMKAYASAFPRTETDEGTRIPVFYLETPSPVTVKGMAAAMLEQLGDPAAHRGAIWSMNARLVKLLIACGVELVILDDFHHLIDTDTNRILSTVSDWLKVLIKDTGVPFLVVGIEGKVEQILRANAQLSRLFATREALCPFRWDLHDQETLREFAQFVLQAEGAIDAPLTKQVARVELLGRIHAATQGLVANIMNLLRYAHAHATSRGSEVVELCDLSIAFQKRLAKHLGCKGNPFGVESQNASDTPSGQRPGASTEGIHPATNRRSRRRRKKQGVSAEAAETLRAR